MLSTSTPQVTTRKEWTNYELTLASQARTLTGLKLSQHVRKLQASSGRRKRDCVLLIHRGLEQDTNRRSWSEDDIERVRELLTVHPIETVAEKIGRSTNAVRCLCKREGFSLRDLKCDLFTIYSLAAVMKVRKAEIVFWIEQQWLEATILEKGTDGPARISPEALQRCLRVHMADIQRRNVKSATILQVMTDYCYVPKHDVLKVREALREQEAYDRAFLS